VGSGHKKMDSDKVKAMLDIPGPTTKTQLKRLLNYYRQFIQDFAKNAKLN